MLISDWSSDVCSSDLASVSPSGSWKDDGGDGGQFILGDRDCLADELIGAAADEHGYWSGAGRRTGAEGWARVRKGQEPLATTVDGVGRRSEEHTSELQSLMRISYAVFCLKKNKTKTILLNHNVNNENIFQMA